jgi:hypothetical protein
MTAQRCTVQIVMKGEAPGAGEAPLENKSGQEVAHCTDLLEMNGPAPEEF